MGATVPVRPHVDALGIEWTRNGRNLYSGSFGNCCYVAAFDDPIRGAWLVKFSDGRRPFVELTGERDAIVSGLKAWLVAEGLEVPE